MHTVKGKHQFHRRKSLRKNFGDVQAKIKMASSQNMV